MDEMKAGLRVRSRLRELTTLVNALFTVRLVFKYLPKCLVGNSIISFLHYVSYIMEITCKALATLSLF